MDGNYSTRLSSLDQSLRAYPESFRKCIRIHSGRDAFPSLPTSDCGYGHPQLGGEVFQGHISERPVVFDRVRDTVYFFHAPHSATYAKIGQDKNATNALRQM